MNKKLILKNIFITSSLCILSTSAFAHTYRLTCNSIHCNAADLASRLIENQNTRFTFNAYDYFVAYDSGVAVDSITYSDYQYLKRNGKLPTIQKDGALNCAYDSSFSCADWKKDPGTLDLVNLIQNYTWKDQPLTAADIQFRNFANQVTLGIVAGSILIIPLDGIATVITARIVTQLGSRVIGVVVGGAVTGALGSAATFGINIYTKYEVGDVLIMQNGKVIKVIRKGKEYTIKELGINTSSNGTSGGSGGSNIGGSGGGSLPSGGIVGGGGHHYTGHGSIHEQ